MVTCHSYLQSIIHVIFKLNLSNEKTDECSTEDTRETNIDRQKKTKQRGMGGEFVEKSGFLFSIKGHSLVSLPVSGNDSPSNLGHVSHTEAHPPTACVSLSVCICVCVC